MKVFLDDNRETPAGWVRCYWPDEVIAHLKTREVTALSLDHDLGDDERGTGYDVIAWLEERVFNEPDFPVPAITIHSDNAVGRERMQAGIESISRFAKKTSPPE